jgi:hypothetical protein
MLQSSSNGAIILMQDLLNLQIRMNYPGTGLIIFHNTIFILFLFKNLQWKIPNHKTGHGVFNGRN